MSLSNITYNQIRTAYEKLGYSFYVGKKDYNLNMGAIRSADLSVDVFNDIVFVAWEYKGKQHLHTFRATTDPGLHYLLKPIHPNGTALLAPGHYSQVYKLGIHAEGKKFAHKALIQQKTMRYWRIKDYKKGNPLPINPQQNTYTGRVHTNLHCYPLSWTLQKAIGKLSAGCIVIADNMQYHKVFIPLVEESIKNFGNSFSFSLFDESEVW